MKKIVLFLFCLSVASGAFAQITIRENQTIISDKVFILENQSIGKSFKFYAGNSISLLTKNNPTKISGKITEILDSSIVIANNYVVDLHNISVVYTDRAGIQIVSSVLILFGVMFIGVDVLNNVINADHPIIKSKVAIISASSLAMGGLLWLFVQRKCTVAHYKWKVKIIETTRVKH